jgi:hypothetical protein
MAEAASATQLIVATRRLPLALEGRPQPMPFLIILERLDCGCA